MFSFIADPLSPDPLLPRSSGERVHEQHPMDPVVVNVDVCFILDHSLEVERICLVSGICIKNSGCFFFSDRNALSSWLAENRRTPRFPVLRKYLLHPPPRNSEL